LNEHGSKLIEGIKRIK